MDKANLIEKIKEFYDYESLKNIGNIYFTQECINAEKKSDFAAVYADYITDKEKFKLFFNSLDEKKKEIFKSLFPITNSSSQMFNPRLMSGIFFFKKSSTNSNLINFVNQLQPIRRLITIYPRFLPHYSIQECFILPVNYLPLSQVRSFWNLNPTIYTTFTVPWMYLQKTTIYSNSTYTNTAKRSSSETVPFFTMTVPTSFSRLNLQMVISNLGKAKKTNLTRLSKWAYF